MFRKQVKWLDGWESTVYTWLEQVSVIPQLYEFKAKTIDIPWPLMNILWSSRGIKLYLVDYRLVICLKKWYTGMMSLTMVIYWKCLRYYFESNSRYESQAAFHCCCSNDYVANKLCWLRANVCCLVFLTFESIYSQFVKNLKNVQSIGNII